MRAARFGGSVGAGEHVAARKRASSRANTNSTSLSRSEALAKRGEKRNEGAFRSDRSRDAFGSRADARASFLDETRVFLSAGDERRGLG